MDQNLQFYALVDGKYLPVTVFFVDQSDGTAQITLIDGKPTYRGNRWNNRRGSHLYLPISDIYTLDGGEYRLATLEELSKRMHKCFFHDISVTEKVSA